MAVSQFLLLTAAEGLKAGGTLRVVAAAGTEDEAKDKLESLDASVLGRIAVVEVKQLYERRPAVQNIPSDAPLLEGDR
jgi:16S rRNA G1207 methylase RsmC